MKDVAWIPPSSAAEPASTLALSVKILECGLLQSSPVWPAVASELIRAFAAERTLVAAASGGWTVALNWPEPKPPLTVAQPVLSESLDRLAVANLPASDKQPASLVCPLDPQLLPNRLILLQRSAEQFNDEQGRQLGAIRGSISLALAHAGRIERAESLLEVTRELILANDTQTVLERIATHATRLLEADRASIFVWDKANKQLVARPALGIPGGELRLPDDVGVVGDVLKSGHTSIVHDVAQDERFNSGVDSKSGYQTHTMLCVPLTEKDGNRVGAFQVLNKSNGTFTDEDRQTLEMLADQACVALQNAQERENLVRTNAQLTNEASSRAQIIGVSPAIESLHQNVQRISVTDLPVLILGESGSGKEVVARSIHYGSPRHDRPFIPVNCAAIAETLLESELFGHEKGAFTDAREQRQGKFELASGGSLFLDEIGDMSAGGQAKLLRVLEEKTIYRVGGSQPIHTDTRIVAATNRNLADFVQAGKFRQDLFFRLSVVTIALPPLRERREDIIPMAEFFLEQFCRDARRKQLRISAEARKRLEAHEWPGNVRELRNLMERLAFLTARDTIEPDDLAFILVQPTDQQGWAVPPGLGLNEATAMFQTEYISEAIDRARGNQAEAARGLGLHRSNLYRKMRQLEMTDPIA